MRDACLVPSALHPRSPKIPTRPSSALDDVGVPIGDVLVAIAKLLS